VCDLVPDDSNALIYRSFALHELILEIEMRETFQPIRCNPGPVAK
jgi:hypothetical protein